MKKLLDELRSRRSEIFAIAYKHGIADVRVFGSVARGEENNNSDIDLLIRQNRGVSLFEIVDFQYEIENYLGKKVDIVLEDGINKYLKELIFSEAVSI